MRKLRHLLSTSLATLIVATLSVSASAQVPVATYLFGNTLNAEEGGAPALTQTNPLGLNGFENAVVFGQNRTVFRTDGNSANAEQAGLTLDTTGLVPSDSYSVEMVFEFLDGNDEWRRIIDVEDRQSDSGFYVNPDNNIEIFPVSGGSNAWTNNTFHHVVLTVSPGSPSSIVAYLDGNLEFNLDSDLMDIAHANNPGDLMNFYLDNVFAGGQGEFSDARTALIRLYDTALSAGQVETLAENPFGTGGGAAAPEPGTVGLVGMGLLALGMNIARRRR